MKRLVIGTACLPVALLAAGYGAVRVLAGYFENPVEWADRIGQMTNDHIDAQIAAGLFGPSSDDPR